MRYEKPIVMDLSAGARAAGRWPLACISGGTATDTETCGTGTAAGWTCSAGTNGALGDTCYEGSNPGSGWEDCFPGSSATYCASGLNGDTDPYGCRSGPVP